jgi:hypothetical protein
MLLTRAEMTFDFGGARLDPARDAELLGWTMDQFLYGEVTGIQCGHWLYRAPDLEAARFFARQAVEEFQHVENFARIHELLGTRPGPAHPLVRFLTSGMMPGSFAEHVCLEMAQGEGLVLVALYALIDTLDMSNAAAAAVREILLRAVRQEERHVAFGERRTRQALAARPSLRARLLGQSLVSLWGVERLGRFLRGRLPAGHPVLQQLPAFLAFTTACAERRLLRMGVLQKPLAETTVLQKAWALVAAYPLSLLEALLLLPLRLLPRPLDPLVERRLTETYLHDPGLAARARPQAESAEGEEHAH